MPHLQSDMGRSGGVLSAGDVTQHDPAKQGRQFAIRALVEHRDV